MSPYIKDRYAGKKKRSRILEGLLAIRKSLSIKAYCAIDKQYSDRQS